MTKKGIFISHIHEEAALGAVVKSWMTDAFHGNATPFLSTDKQALPAGSKWLDVIENQFADTGVVISLLSPISIARPWVNIELGAAWIRRIPIIPLCHSGQRADTLPKPFSDFTGLTLGDADVAKHLIGGVANALGLRYSQRLAFTECQKEMINAAALGKARPVASAPLPSTLPPEQIAILKMLADAENQGIAEVPSRVAPSECCLSALQFKAHIAQLKSSGFVHDTLWGGDTHYRTSPAGASWLLENDHA